MMWRSAERCDRNPRGLRSRPRRPARSCSVGSRGAAAARGWLFRARLAAPRAAGCKCGDLGQAPTLVSGPEAVASAASPMIFSRRWKSLRRLSASPFPRSLIFELVETHIAFRLSISSWIWRRAVEVYV